MKGGAAGRSGCRARARLDVKLAWLECGDGGWTFLGYVVVRPYALVLAFTCR